LKFGNAESAQYLLRNFIFISRAVEDLRGKFNSRFARVLLSEVRGAEIDFHTGKHN